MAIRFIDLCSGIEGFHSGLMATGHYKCVGHSEIDRHAEQAYQAIISNGWCLTANTSESRNSEEGCTLSDILMEDVPEKYFLSEAAMRKILNSLSPALRDSESMKQTE